MSNALKTWPAPWTGDVLLACRKCQKKLKKNDRLYPLSRLKKAVKARNKLHPQNPLHVVPVACMKLCPRDAVTICRPSQDPDRLSLLRSESDLDTLFR